MNWLGFNGMLTAIITISWLMALLYIIVEVLQIPQPYMGMIFISAMLGSMPLMDKMMRVLPEQLPRDKQMVKAVG